MMLRLLVPSSAEWVAVASSRLGEVLVDHAHCEHKAAASALALVSRYGDDPVLVEELCKLASEEASHLREVAAICARRGLSLGKPAPDPYVRALRSLVRGNVVQERIDRLLVAAIVEARSCERLKLLAERVVDEELRPVYDALWRSEARHYALFVELARRSGDVDARLAELCEEEARILAALPVRAAVH